MTDPQETGGGKMTQSAGPRGSTLERYHFLAASRLHVGMCIQVMEAHQIFETGPANAT